MAGTIKIGFVGAGGIARAHADALEKVNGVSIVGVVDADENSARVFAEKAGAETFPSPKALIADCELDALYIVVPPFARGDAERAALAANLPFFSEKPLGLDLGMMSEIAAEVEHKGLLTCTGYMNRYRRGVQAVRSLLNQEPAILAYGGWWGGTPGPGNHWFPNRAKSGGQFHEQVTHTVDLARYFLGEAVEVFAAHAIGFVRGVEGYSTDDALTAVIRFANGGVANIMSSMSSNAGGGVFLNLHSMNRNFKFTGWEHSLQITSKGEEAETIPGEPDIFTIEDAAFIESVRTKNRSLIQSSYADGVKSAAVSLAVNLSVDSGKPVSLPN